MRAAQLQDDRFLAEIELEIEEQSRRPSEAYRPPMEHFDPVVDAIYGVSDDIRMLINAQIEGDPLPFRARPETPADRIEARKREIARNRNAEATGQEV